MFLQVVGKKYVQRKNFLNLVVVLFTIVWVVIGYLTIKRSVYRYIEDDELRHRVVQEASRRAYQSLPKLNVSQMIWEVEIEFLTADRYVVFEPVRDILLIINTFMGFADDIGEPNSWWVILFSLVGYCIFAATIVRICLWMDERIDKWFDDGCMYKELGNENEFRDFVLEYRRQKREQADKPVEIRSFASREIDVKKCYGSLAEFYLVPIKTVSPAFIYPAMYAIVVFVLTAIHTWKHNPHVFIENLKQILLCATMWRISHLIVEFYLFCIGKNEDVKPIFVDSIYEVTDKNDKKDA
ncbi:unnamed protein product [Caenorhabditis bovis]|uniref:Uncharacterized protein n=1 Tax=Caenorhabditis bovis TaxID=2654633 RepID=A0A8S1ETZ1_9PELO|nr:unnamed protein product [Caenorhabditis bovis]